MTVRGSLRRTRSVLNAELAAIRSRDPDLDAGDITRFSLPLLLRAVGVLAVGFVPLLVVRSSADTDALLVPLIGSLALTAICTAAVAWLMAITISAVVVMVVYRTPPAASSRLVTRILSDSFGRIEDQTSTIALLSLIAGLVSLAVGLPTRQGDELAHSVVDDLSPPRWACCWSGWRSRSSSSRSVRPPTSSTTSPCCSPGRGRWSSPA